MLDDGDLTDDLIESKSAFPHLTPKDREHFKEKLRESKSRKSDAEILSNVMDIALDPTIPQSTKYKVIRDNTGLDDEGKPRLTDSDARTIHNFVESDKNAPDYYMKYVKDLFDDALKNEWINDEEYARLNKDFYGRIAEGDLTQEGIMDLGKNLLIQISEDFAKKTFKADEDYRWRMFKGRRKEEMERYFEEHEPETIEEMPEVEYRRETEYEKTAINPKTGERLGLKDGKWVPIE